MQLTNGSLKFTRQLGIGEREHVRSGLLGVGFFYKDGIIEQITGAVRAANQLNMMLRVHVNMDRFTPDEQANLFRVMANGPFVSHQFEPWSHLTRAEFDSMCKKAEIIITPSAEPAGDIAADTCAGITSIWAQSGGRFLKGNFAQLSDEQLKPLWPQFYYDTEQFWEQWNA